MPLDPVVTTVTEQWLTQLSKARQSANTIASHRYAIGGLLRWLNDQPDNVTLATIDLPTLDQYVEFLKDTDTRLGLAHSTIYAYIGVITRWLQYLSDKGILVAIPDTDGDHVTPARVRQLLERLLSKRETPVAPRVPDLRRLPGYYQQELQTFLARHGMPHAQSAAALRRGYLNLLRNRALVGTLFCTGGRISEVLSLNVAHVQRNARIVTAAQIEGKGRRRRPLRLDDTARAWIGEYLGGRATFYPGAQALFLSHGPKAAGKRMSDVSAWRVVKEAAVALATIREAEGAMPEEVDAILAVSPHTLRHYLAQAMLDEGADYKDLTAILGHSSAVVTEQFYARISDQRALEAADTFAPRPVIDFGSTGDRKRDKRSD